MKTPVNASMLTIWEAAGKPTPKMTPHRAPHHAEVMLPDGLIVDREVAQMIASLRASGIRTVECCADGWGSGLAYVIVEAMNDLDHTAALLGHSISPAARAGVNSATNVAASQALGPWWPSNEGWAIGWVAEPDRPRPALAWPREHTTTLTERMLAATGLEPVKVKRLPFRQWLQRR